MQADAARDASLRIEGVQSRAWMVSRLDITPHVSILPMPWTSDPIRGAGSKSPTGGWPPRVARN
jgi:hypothetical protein